MTREVFAGSCAARSITLQNAMVEQQQDKLRGFLKTPTASRHFIPVPQDSSAELLRQEAIKAGLLPSHTWFGKVEQLHAMTQLKHGIYNN